MYYYPSRCLGKAVLEGTFENQPLPSKEETNEAKEDVNDENEGEPEAKKSKLSKEQFLSKIRPLQKFAAE